jgi:hypothetical protein
MRAISFLPATVVQTGSKLGLVLRRNRGPHRGMRLVSSLRAIRVARHFRVRHGSNCSADLHLDVALDCGL